MRILVQLTMAAMLGAFAKQLVDATPQHPPSEHAKQVVDANNRLLFKRAHGFDVRGKRVNLPEGSRVVAFVLRASSLSEDLRLWSDVSALVAADPRIRLVAYCDGATCVQQLRSDTAKTAFPVIAFAEMIDAQAVLNADADGFFLSKPPGDSERAKGIQWRENASTASDIARMVLS